MKSKDKGVDKIIGRLIDIKHEIETTHKIKIDLDKSLSNVEKELNKKGYKLEKTNLLKIKNILKQEDKRKKNHVKYIEATMYLEGYEFNQIDELLMFPEAKKHKDDKKEDKEDVVLPALLVYGVAVTLCGFFLICLPIPTCKDWGGRMIVAGVTACANSICNKVDEDKKEEHKKHAFVEAY